MSILVNESTKVIVQGFTGNKALFTPNKPSLMEQNSGRNNSRPWRRKNLDRPIFNTVGEAVEETGANASMIFVPPPFAADAIAEAADAG